MASTNGKLSNLQKTVTLPSGRKALISKVTGLNFADIFGVDSDVNNTVRLITVCTLKPKLAPYPRGDERIKEGEMSLEDLPISDFIALSRAINDFSGLDEALASVDPTLARTLGDKPKGRRRSRST